MIRLPCGHKQGTFTEDTIEYCKVCGQAADIDDFMQKIANKMNAPVFGQLVGRGTVLPNNKVS